jgi:glutamate racemase
MSDERAIGVFDSGVGGLTVARAIMDLLPNEPIRYVGDTARFPYGPRPLEEIRRFALEIAEHLVSTDVKMLVVACNSIEVAAIREVTDAAGVPVGGVIEPGARAAVRATRNGNLGLIGTQATVESGAYERAVDRVVAATATTVLMRSVACPLFVEAVERGDTTSPELRAAADGYLRPLRDGGIDTLILGCTHYPLLSGLLSYVVGPEVVLVSSAEETAKEVYAALVGAELERADEAPPRHEFGCTGSPAAFQAVAERFLGPETAEVRASVVELVGG